MITSIKLRDLDLISKDLNLDFKFHKINQLFFEIILIQFSIFSEWNQIWLWIWN